QAIGLAGRLTVELDYRHVYRPVHQLLFLGALTAGLTPSGQVNIQPWLAQVPLLVPAPQWGGGRRPPPMQPAPTAFSSEIWRSVAAPILLNESALEFPQRNPISHFQLDTNGWGLPRPSQSLGDLRFPAPAGFGEDKLIHTEADDFELV